MNKSIKNEQLSKRGLLERVARMYYVLGMNQQEIADQLEVGRSSVARFLNEAREEGIVQFHIRSRVDKSRNNQIEQQLQGIYKMRDVVVLKNNQSSINSFETLVVQYLNSILPFQGSIGLGWGKTLYSVGQYMHLAESRPNLKVVQLSGSSGGKENVVPASRNIQTWAQAFDAQAYFLPAPAIVEKPENKDLFLQNESIRNVYEEIKKVDMAIVGIGHTKENSTILQANLVHGLTSEDLESHSVGDVIFHFFNEKGEFSFKELSDRVIGASTFDFMRIPIRIGIAYGDSKQQAIRGALTGGIVNILITDENTAKLLI